MGGFNQFLMGMEELDFLSDGSTRHSVAADGSPQVL
jgi:hypothetical protein